MAAAVFKKILADKGQSDNFEVLSRGVAVFPGDPASENAVLTAAKYGIDISAHRSAGINVPLIDNADQLICMTESHAAVLRSLGAAPQKITVLSVPDPYGGDLSVYENCAADMYRKLTVLAGKILNADIVIKKADASCAAGIAAVEKEALGNEAWTERGIAETINANGIYFAAESDGKTVAAAGMTVAADECYITNISVLSAYRRRGFASALLGKLIDTCKENGAAFLSLEVRKSNCPAIKLYEKYGFTVRGTRPGFYRDPKEDALIMTLDF